MLNKSITAQMNIMLRRKSVFFTFYIVLALVLANFITNVLTYRGYDVLEMHQSVKLLLLSGDSGAYSYYFMQIYPILVVLPVGFSFALDRDSNEAVFLYTRVGGKNYFIGKMLAVFLVAFGVFSAPLLLEIGLNALSFPAEAVGDLSNINVYERVYVEGVRRYFLYELYVCSPSMYAILFTLIFGAISGVFSVFTVAVSTFRIKYKVLLFLPVYVLLFGIGMLKQLVPSINVYTSYFFYFRMFDITPKSGLGYMGFLLVLLSVSISIFVINGRKDWLQ